jgi:ribosomal-protein-serine acetyltransferase
MTFPAVLEVDGTLRLATVELADCTELFALLDGNRAHLRQWLPWLDINQSTADTRAYIERSRHSAAQGSGWNLLIRHQHKLCGTIGFNWIDRANRACELGYWLAEDATGKGLITRSVRALVDFAFNDLALNRINLSIAAGNQPSRIVAERLGFTEEGTARQAEWLYDHYVDLVRYALLREHWPVE